MIRKPMAEVIPTRPSLLRRIKNWTDDESWKDFSTTYRGLIFGFALKRGLNESEAEDVVQETMVSVAKSIGQFQYEPARCAFKSWLMQLTQRRITDHLRRNAREQLANNPQSSEHESAMNRIPDPAESDLERLWNEEWERNLIETAMNKLKAQVSVKHFQIFYLHVIKNQPTRQVARALALNVAQVYLVKHRLKSAFDKIVVRLQREWAK